MARPKKKEEDKYKHSVTFWVTDEEWNMLNERSDAAGMTTSEYIRSILHGKNVKLHYIVENTYPDIVEKIDQFGKPLSEVGNNLNQIARRLNSDEPVNDKMVNKVNDIQNEVRKIRVGLEELETEVNGKLEQNIY